MFKKRLKFALISLLIVFVTAISIVKIYQFKDERLFTQEKWIKKPDRRYLIVNNMIEKYNFTEMTKEQVIKLLGKPDEKYEKARMLPRLNKKPINSYDHNSIFYFIHEGNGPEEVSGFYVRFNDGGKVIDYAILDFTT